MHVHHLALRTLDVPRLVAFYRDLLGLRPAPDEGPRSATAEWLVAGPTRVMIERREDGEPATPAGSRDLIAFCIEAADRSRVRSRLATAGVAVEQETPYTLYFRDPDGRRIGLSHYPETAAGEPSPPETRSPR